MKKLLHTFTLLALCLCASTAWADEVTLDFTSTEGLTALGLKTPTSDEKNNYVLLNSDTYTQGDVSLSATNGASKGQETKIFYSSGLSLRVYKGGSITLSVSKDKVITSVIFNLLSIKYYGCFTASSGSFNYNFPKS